MFITRVRFFLKLSIELTQFQVFKIFHLWSRIYRLAKCKTGSMLKEAFKSFHHFVFFSYLWTPTFRFLKGSLQILIVSNYFIVFINQLKLRISHYPCEKREQLLIFIVTKTFAIFTFELTSRFRRHVKLLDSTRIYGWFAVVYQMWGCE